MKAKLLLLLLFISTVNSWSQTLFSENMGSPSGTSTIVSNIFQNNGLLSYSNGAQTSSADVRVTSPSSSYSNASGGGNVFFSSTSGAYGFSIEGINASNYNTLSLQFGYKKESAAVHATLSVDYWNGTSWVTLANTSTALFNEGTNASAVWYLSKALALPSDAQINGLKLRFVKTGSTSIRIDDVKLSGIEILPTVTNDLVSYITSNSATFAGTVTATGGSSIVSNGTVFSITGSNPNPVLGGVGVVTLATSSPGNSTGTFSNNSGTTLSPNIEYSYNAYATKSTGATGYGAVNTFYTHAITPSIPNITNPTGTSLDITLGSDTNSSLTTYAIFEATTSKYVQVNGTLGTSALYQTAASWGTRRVLNLLPNTSYTFEIIAKNGNGLTTAASSAANGTTLQLPAITATGSLVALNTTYGTASSFTSFAISGTNLTDNILITVPTGFEVSKTSGGASGYAPTQVLNQVSGNVNETIIYVRLAANAGFGTYAGNVALTSINDNLTVNFATDNSSVHKKDLFLTGIFALDKEYDGDTVAMLNGTPVLNGLLAGDSTNVALNSAGMIASFSDAFIGMAKTVTVSGYTLTGTAAGNYSLVQPSGLIANITANIKSDIVFNSGSTTSDNTNINYRNYQASSITSTVNSVGVMGFYLRDGGSNLNDADNLSTELQSISFNVSNSSNIRSARLFVGNSPRGNTVAVVNGVLTFTGLTDVIALDNTQLAINLRVTFNSVVTDNEQMQFVIAGVTANTTGSQFALSNAGGATSSMVGDVNRVEVTASKLVFQQQPPVSLFEGIIMNPHPLVVAKDENDNTDVDYVNIISIVSSGSLINSPQQVVPNSGGAIFDNIVHSHSGDGIVLTASALGLINASSNSFIVNTTVLPIFDPVAPICFGTELEDLPTTSTNGISGSWSPALDNTETITYTFTPNAGQNASITTLTVVVNPDVTPTFDEVNPICFGAELPALPIISTNEVVGTWSPELNNTVTTTYTFTPQGSNRCTVPATLTINVNSMVKPTFEEIESVCSGAVINDLPTTSIEGITGSWTPTINNQTTTTYTFTPDEGQCAESIELTIFVNQLVVPTFTEIPSICSETTESILSNTSLEGIEGTWLPQFDPNQTTIYTFTPDDNQCAASTSVTVVVNPSITPLFDEVIPICLGGSLNDLPTTSLNGITGSWSPELDETTTTTYTFTPDEGQCGKIAVLTVVINPNIPSFNAVTPICAGETLNALPTTSTNGYTGSWSPELNNMLTTEYTFIPDEGQCASNTTLTITVNALSAFFDDIVPICADTSPEALPTTSTNGVTGVWSVNTNATDIVYTFTPDTGQCTEDPVTFIASPNIIPTFDEVEAIRAGELMNDLPTTSLNGIDGSWLPELNNMQTTTYTFTPLEGQCATTTTITIEVVNTGGQVSLPPPPTSPTGGSNEVGVTVGELSVSSSGGAIYNIPITVPPGINGVEPQIGLSYNSQGGYGLAGYGWNITGLSTITRIPSTKFHDNIIDAVDFDSNDRYSFDGQRLMLKSGTYAAANSVYETENFSNTKITFLGTHFKVQYPDGSSALYGSTADSKVGQLTYALKQWTNAQGVTIIYTYTQLNNTLYINSIKYGSTSSSSTQINDIQFEYKGRNRPEQYFIGGMSIKNERVLSQIKVKGSGVGFRNYVLTHDVVFGYERLKKITEKNGDGSKSYNPTVFEYEDNSESGITSYAKAGFLDNQPICNSSLPDNELYYNGDFDGDGDPDFIYGNKLFTKIYDNASVPLIECVVDSSTPNGFVSSVSTDPVRCLEQNPNGYNIMNRDALCKVQRSYPGDNINTLNINVYAKNLSSNSMVQEYSKKVFMNQEIKMAKSGDFNGDALTDYIFIADSNTQNPHFYFFNLDRRIPASNSVTDLGIINLGHAKNKISTGDFNGDGKTDIICFSGNNTIKIYSLGDNNLELLWQTAFTFLHPGTTELFKEVIKYNCRHVPNWVYYCCERAGDCISQPAGSNIIYGCINTDQYGRPQYDRSGWIDISTETLCDYKIYNYPFIVGDFNSDGKSDVLLPGLERTVLMSTGISFESEGLSSVYPPAHDLGIGTLQTDYNNDGKNDFLNIKRISTNKFSINNYQRVSKGNWIKNISTTFTKSLGTADSATFTPVMVLPSKTNFTKPQLLAFSKNITEISSTSYSVSDNKAIFFTNENSFTNNKLIQSFTLGNGVKETVIYRPLTETSGIYTSAGQLTNYPNYDIANSSGIKVVSQIEKQSYTSYKRRLYKYYGFTSNVEGLGFLGFRSVLKTDWFSAISNAISTITKFDMNYRGAPIESFTVQGIVSPILNLQPTDSYISRTIHTYNNNYADNPLLSNKVYKLRNTFSQIFNGLQETITDVSSEYDVFNLKKRTALIHSNNSTESKSIVEDFALYDDLPGATPYIIGRPRIKKSTITLLPSGEESVVEEEYFYTNNLLTQTKRRLKNSGELSHYIFEINDYNYAYGNLIKKTLKAPDANPPIADRVTSYEYDTQTNRFITKKTDILGLQTVYTYDLSKGLKLSETLPSNNGFPLKTNFVYDTWGKRIKTTKYLGSNTSYILTDTYTNLNGGAIQNTTVGNDGSASKVIVDDLGRKIHELGKDINDKWTCKTTVYDFNDMPIKISQPYFVTGSAMGNFTVWDEMKYDVHGRIQQLNALKSGVSNGKQTIFGYNGLTETETDLQKQKIVVKDIFGNLMSVNETNAEGVSYTYFANGNLKSTTSGNAVTTITQDGWGRKKTLDDPSAGVYNYIYNDFNELLSEEIVGKGITNYNLDSFGRITSKTVAGYTADTPSTTTTYTYDSATKLLKSMVFADPTNNNTINYTYDYDSYKRIKKAIEKRNLFFEFQKEYLFDSFGRPEKEHFYAKDLSTNKVSSKWIKTNYKNGYKWQLYDMNNSTSVGSVKLWQTNTVDQQGNTLTAALGNGVNITNTFNSIGFPTQIKHDKGASNIMTLNTDFEAINGNLTRRNYNLFNWDERPTYDNLDRLKTYKDPLSTTAGQLNQTYNSTGTIASNIIGDYAYTEQDKPYSLTSITPDQSPTSPALLYYSNREQNVGFNIFKSPTWITEQGKENINFNYNAFDSRSVMYYGNEETNITARSFRKFYSTSGSMEIKRRVAGNVNEFVTYIGGDGYTAPVVLKSNGTIKNYFYLHRDYQGSILAISDSQGAVVEKRLFDVWGALIKYSSYGVTVPPTTSTGLFLDRGYTGHEHLLGVGLINMNGRIYDPKLHRFLQPDNNIQDPLNTQNFNRYAYCLNNPTKYIDPTGEYGEGGPGPGGPEFGGTLLQFGGALLSNFAYQGAYNNNYNNPYGNNTYGGHINYQPAAPTYSVSNFSGSYQDTYNFNQNSNINLDTPRPFVYGDSGTIQMPTQHTFIGINMTALSEGNMLEQTLYGAANQVNIVAQFLMCRSVGDSSMRNLNGTATTTDEGVMAFGTLPLYLVGGGGAVGARAEGAAVRGGGKTISQRTANLADDFSRLYQGTLQSFSQKSAKFVLENNNILNKGNWWRLGVGRNQSGAYNIRLAWGAHPNHLNEVPKFLQPLNRWLRGLGEGHWHFPNWLP